MICRPDPRFVLALATLFALGAPLAAAGERSDWTEVGRAHYRAGRHEQALSAAVSAVEATPADPRALEFRGQLLRDAEGMPAALAWFERALEKAPDDMGLLGEYAATLGEAGRNGDMLRIARRMVEIDPKNPRAYFLQAVLAARAGRDDLARRLLWRTDGAYDGTPAGQLLAGVLELHTGNPALAVDQFDALAKRQPDNTMVRMLLGRALLANGEANEVIARLGPLAGRPDASPYLLTLVGRAYERLGRRMDAASYLDRAASPIPAVLVALPAGAGSRPPGVASEVPALRQMLAQGRGGEALAFAARLGARYPGSADVALLVGDTALLAGDPSGALDSYGRVAMIRRPFALVARMVAAERARGRGEAAYGLLADYLARNPRSGPAAAMLGRLLAERGRWPEAAALLDHARRFGGGGRDPLLLADLGIAQAMSGQRAEEPAREAYALQRANGRATVALARILEADDPSSPGTVAMLAKARRLMASSSSAAR